MRFAQKLTGLVLTEAGHFGGGGQTHQQKARCINDTGLKEAVRGEEPQQALAACMFLVLLPSFVNSINFSAMWVNYSISAGDALLFSLAVICWL
jgi:hypothetical protein